MQPSDLRSEHGEVGDVYLTRTQIAARVAELGAEIARDYSGLEPILVAPLKSSVVFLADLTRAVPIPHALDLVELAPYVGTPDGGIRLLKDVDAPIAGRHVLIVEDVVDTGLTLNYLIRTLDLRRWSAAVRQRLRISCGRSTCGICGPRARSCACSSSG